MPPTTPTPATEPRTIAAAAAAMRSAAWTSVALTTRALARAQDPQGQGSTVFLSLYPQAALADALAADRAHARGAARSLLEGLVVSIKDLFDVAGEVTRAGSRVLCDGAPAQQDAVAVQRLREAGAVIVGKTNMTELAYSGLGLNPHYGTPRNPCDPVVARIPGGSSSGAAVAVAEGMCWASVATDTGGSVRIPAAFCGLVGFKPTARRTDRQGVAALSPTLDSVGVIARSVDCCAQVDAVLAGEPLGTEQALPARDIVLGVVSDYLGDGLDAHVAATFERALSRLSAAGVRLRVVRFPELHELPQLNAAGGFSAVESHRLYGGLLARRPEAFDPRVAARMHKGEAWSSEQYAQLLRARRQFIDGTRARFDGVDALVCPTVPIVAPRVDELLSDDAFARLNLLVLRNPAVVNFLDGCAWSLPCQSTGDLPVGLSLFQAALGDRALRRVALTIEAILSEANASA